MRWLPLEAWHPAVVSDLAGLHDIDAGVIVVAARPGTRTLAVALHGVQSALGKVLTATARDGGADIEGIVTAWLKGEDVRLVVVLSAQRGRPGVITSFASFVAARGVGVVITTTDAPPAGHVAALEALAPSLVPRPLQAPRARGAARHGPDPAPRLRGNGRGAFRALRRTFGANLHTWERAAETIDYLSSRSTSRTARRPEGARTGSWCPSPIYLIYALRAYAPPNRQQRRRGGRLPPRRRAVRSGASGIAWPARHSSVPSASGDQAP